MLSVTAIPGRFFLFCTPINTPKIRPLRKYGCDSALVPSPTVRFKGGQCPSGRTNGPTDGTLQPLCARRL